MKALVVGLVFASVIGTAMAAKSSRKDLLFIGKVTAIGTAKTGDPRRNWIVSTSVEKVLSGTFSGETFDFAIHSPSRAGLEVGKSYKIPARWTGTGYLVDDFEVWKRNH
jgi:hypothetical protein